jgi:hypothetical protein
LAKFRQIAKLKIPSDFGDFQSPEEERGKKKRKNHQIDFYIWFSVGSQKYRMMIKEWYFIFG